MTGIAEGIEKIARKRKERGEDEATVRKALCEDFETGEDEANRIVELVFKSQVSLRFAFTTTSQVWLTQLSGIFAVRG